MRFEIAAQSVQGGRSYQEDTWALMTLDGTLATAQASSEGGAAVPDGALVIVADGMGGEGGGAEASHIVAAGFAQSFFEPPMAQMPVEERLEASLAAANAGLQEAKRQGGELQERSGCTIIAGVVGEGGLHFVSVGDSSIWRFPASTGVPRHDVVCAAGDAARNPTLRCDVRFDEPARVTGQVVGNARNPADCTRPQDCWSSSRRSIGTNDAEVQDDSAFLFIVDRGGSQTVAQRAPADLRELLTRAGTQQQIAIAQFGRTFEMLSDFGTDKQKTLAALSRIRGDNSVTELYKYANESIDLLARRAARRRILVILSDGSAADTAFSAQSVIERAKRADVRIIVIGYAPNRNDTSKLQSLTTIAKDTEGDLVPVRGTGPVPQPQRTGFMDRYTSGYLILAEAPTSSLPDRVNVTLELPDAKTSHFIVSPGVTRTSGVDRPPAMGDSPVPSIDGDSFVDQVLNFILDYWIYLAIAAAIILLLVIGVILLLVRRSRMRNAAIADAQAYTPPPPVTPAYEPPPEPAPHVGITPNLPPSPPPFTPPPAPATVAPQEVTQAPRPVEVGRATSFGNGDATEAPARTVLGASPGKTSFQAPTPPKPITFLEIDERGKQRRIPITKNLALIGRSPENDVVLAGEHVSREHAELVTDGNGSWEIKNRTWRRSTEEGGVNPIEVNGHLVDAESHPLRDGDVVRLGNIGSTRFVFRNSLPA